jgi:hypothetical protein
VISLDASRQPWWLLPNLLSLDAPIVALAWQHVLEVSFHTQTDWFGRAALGLAVWAIYLLDRLLDTRHPAKSTEALRHRFVRDHRTSMLILLAVAITAGLVSVLNAPAVLIVSGSMLSAAVLLYLISVHSGMFPVPKEHAVSILFATGVALAPLAGGSPLLALAVAAVPLCFLCLANTAAIEHFEWSRLHDRARPAPHTLTRWIAERYLGFCLAVAVLCCAGAAFTGIEELRLPLAYSATAMVALVLLHIARNHLSTEAFRVLADAALLSPLPLCILRLT